MLRRPLQPYLISILWLMINCRYLYKLLTMSNNGLPLEVIKELSGHRNLSQLQEYLKVRDEQVLGALNTLSIVSPVAEESGKHKFSGIDENSCKEVIKEKI